MCCFLFLWRRAFIRADPEAGGPRAPELAAERRGQALRSLRAGERSNATPGPIMAAVVRGWMWQTDVAGDASAVTSHRQAAHLLTVVGNGDEKAHLYCEYCDAVSCRQFFVMTKEEMLNHSVLYRIKNWYRHIWIKKKFIQSFHKLLFHFIVLNNMY